MIEGRHVGSKYPFAYLSCAKTELLFISRSFLLFQLEEPFSILPMVGYSFTIGQNAEEIVQWRNIYDDPAKSQADGVVSPS